MILASLNPIERLIAVSTLLETREANVFEKALRPLQVEFPDLAMGTSAISTVFSATLIRLNAFDQVAARIAQYSGHIYLLGDEQLSRLLILPPTSEGLHIDNPTSLLDMVATCGLVYRFNAALKFGYPSRAVVQFRLNGWGRELCDRLGLEAARAQTQVEAQITEQLQPFAHDYRGLISHCASCLRPLNTAEIHRLNRNLPYAVVT